MISFWLEKNTLRPRWLQQARRSRCAPGCCQSDTGAYLRLTRQTCGSWGILASGSY